MALYELRLISNDTVINLIEWDGVEIYTPPSDYYLSPVSESYTDFTQSLVAEPKLYSGNFYGLFNGALSGSLSGSLTGSISGSLTGSISGSATGSFTGSFTGSLSGSLYG